MMKLDTEIEITLLPILFKSQFYFSTGAIDGVRTRGLDLGKVALYQLSYNRIFEMLIYINLKLVNNYFCLILVNMLEKKKKNFDLLIDFL